MEEHLVEYSLGLLDPVTTARVEGHLEAHPEARARLALLEQALAPLAADADDIAPPPGLTLGTLARIAEHRCMLPAAPPTPANQAGPPTRRRMRWPDGVVAAMLLVLVGGLTFPALARQWQAHQRAACANVMRQVHAGLVAYGDDHNDAFPFVDHSSAAGVFVPILSDAGLLGDLRVGCPAARVADAPRRTVADMEALHRTDPAKYREAAFDLAGRYAYSLGYLSEAGRHTGLRRDSGDELPLLADLGDGGANSANHGRSGQNVLRVGGHVTWSANPSAGIDGDNIYLNQERRVRAGLCRQDSVLGAGNAQPFGMD